jgi:hypothetical protein
MTELELHQETQTVTPLHAQMDYARAVSTAHMLPDNYRGKPADIMLAVGLGQSMGLSPAESLYRISVIKGKPTASAELIAANVRKAGHRLRVRGDETTATATIIRADDPDYEFTVTRDLAWAQKMGLADQPNYRKQPGTMLQWRAITAVARLACPEALYGVAYTSDEIADSGDLRPAPATTLAEQIGAQTSDPEDAPDASLPSDEREPTSGSESPLLDPRGKLARHMFASFREAGIEDRDERLRYVSGVVGREVESSGQLTDDEAQQVIEALGEGR